MLVSTPYTEVHVKKSFLSGEPNYGKDETVYGVLVAIRFIFGRAPLYVVWLPKIGAVYDKVDQCAIFNKPETPDQRITMADVGWWDCVAHYWQLTQIKVLSGVWVTLQSRTGKETEGLYLWTCDPQQDPEKNDYTGAQVWHEHKTKNYFFDEDTGVLCCGPNNKMRFICSSLSPDPLESPSWLRVYKDSDCPSRMTHEWTGHFGDSDEWDYAVKTTEASCSDSVGLLCTL